MLRLPAAHRRAGQRSAGQGGAGQWYLLVAVVVEAVVAAQGREGPQANGVRKENLGAGIYPHLQPGRKSVVEEPCPRRAACPRRAPPAPPHLRGRQLRPVGLEIVDDAVQGAGQQHSTHQQYNEDHVGECSGEIHDLGEPGCSEGPRRTHLPPAPSRSGTAGKAPVPHGAFGDKEAGQPAAPSSAQSRGSSHKKLGARLGHRQPPPHPPTPGQQAQVIGRRGGEGQGPPPAGVGQQSVLHVPPGPLTPAHPRPGTEVRPQPRPPSRPSRAPAQPAAAAPGTSLGTSPPSRALAGPHGPRHTVYQGSLSLPPQPVREPPREACVQPPRWVPQATQAGESRVQTWSSKTSNRIDSEERRAERRDREAPPRLGVGGAGGGSSPASPPPPSRGGKAPA